MVKVSHPLSYVCCAPLLLAACQSAPPPEEKMAALSPSPSAQAVVLMDPRADDAMVPAISQVLSDGRVTVYRLDDAAVPPSNLLAVPRPDGTQMNAPLVSSTGVIQLTPPSTGGDKSDPQVTVFSLDSQGGDDSEVKSSELRPALQPPVAAASPLTSPFVSVDAPERTVVAEPLIPPPVEDAVEPVPPPRPPRGMTY